MPEARARVVIGGIVQGVFFRMETRRAARKQGGVDGWVRNLPDGTVEAVFEGEKEAVESMVRWCRQGPPASRVDHVEVEWQEYSGEFSGFHVRY